MQESKKTNTNIGKSIISPSSICISDLIMTIGFIHMPLKLIMELMKMKDRDRFLDNYLYPAITEDFVTFLFPENPHHPRQKYKLTEKGLAWFEEKSKK